MLKIIDKAIKFFFITPKQAAKPIVELALSPEFENITGKYFAKGKAIASNPITDDPILTKKVWEISEKLVDLN